MKYVPNIHNFPCDYFRKVNN